MNKFVLDVTKSEYDHPNRNYIHLKLDQIHSFLGPRENQLKVHEQIAKFPYAESFNFTPGRILLMDFDEIMKSFKNLQSLEISTCVFYGQPALNNSLELKSLKNLEIYRPFTSHNHSVR